MRFAILGAGALGTILGAHLSRAGHDVAMIARGDRARAIRRQGLVVSGLSSIEARPAVIDDPNNVGETDTLVVATKAIDTAETLASIAHVRLQNALSLQNGVIKDELLARVFGPSRMLGAMADFSGELLASGEVKFTRNAGLYLGETAGGAEGAGRGTSARAEEIAKLVDAAGVRCEATPDIRTREWSKFAGWIPMFVLAVLTRQITWKFLTDPQTAVVVVRIARETAALAAALQDRARGHVAAARPEHRECERRTGDRDRPWRRQDFLREVAGASNVRAAGRAARQQARIRGDGGVCAREEPRGRRADADAG